MSEERVNTGGEKTFVYSKGYNSQLTTSEKMEIDEAYKKADKRKLIKRIVIGLILLVIFILGYILIKNG